MPENARLSLSSDPVPTKSKPLLRSDTSNSPRIPDSNL